MLKLLSLLNATDKEYFHADQDEKFTRFKQHHVRKQLLREDANPALKRRPVADPAVAQVPHQKTNSADHLHSETEIPVEMLRKALPARFAKIEAPTQ
jgi:hypothetical protein